MSEETSCPCYSGRSYLECCKPYFDGKVPENALALMRSRYTAYVLNRPEYIIATTHPASPHYSENKFSWKRALSNFSRNSDFHKLEILELQEREDKAMVVFTAYLSRKGKDGSFTERSYFERVGGCWLYKCGKLTQGHAPHLVTTHQLRVLPMAYYGDEVLRKRAEPVEKIDEDIALLVEEMKETMIAHNGGGLAAPQVHHSIRLFIVERFEESEGKIVQPNPYEIDLFINPEIKLLGRESCVDSEGCLSIPGLGGDVERATEIEISYTNLAGERLTERCSGWRARVIQHEYDHIEGILFIDRMERRERERLESQLADMKERIHKSRAL